VYRDQPDALIDAVQMFLKAPVSHRSPPEPGGRGRGGLHPGESRPNGWKRSKLGSILGFGSR
jgi:hypothetical protein